MKTELRTVISKHNQSNFYEIYMFLHFHKSNTTIWLYHNKKFVYSYVDYDAFFKEVFTEECRVVVTSTRIYDEYYKMLYSIPNIVKEAFVVSQNNKTQTLLYNLNMQIEYYKNHILNNNKREFEYVNGNMKYKPSRMCRSQKREYRRFIKRFTKDIINHKSNIYKSNIAINTLSKLMQKILIDITKRRLFQTITE